MLAVKHIHKKIRKFHLFVNTCSLCDLGADGRDWLEFSADGWQPWNTKICYICPETHHIKIKSWGQARCFVSSTANAAWLGFVLFTPRLHCPLPFPHFQPFSLSQSIPVRTLIWPVFLLQRHGYSWTMYKFHVFETSISSHIWSEPRGSPRFSRGKLAESYKLSFRTYFSLAKKHDRYQCIFSFPAPAKT